MGGKEYILESLTAARTGTALSKLAAVWCLPHLHTGCRPWPVASGVGVRGVRQTQPAAAALMGIHGKHRSPQPTATLKSHCLRTPLIERDCAVCACRAGTTHLAQHLLCSDQVAGLVELVVAAVHASKTDEMRRRHGTHEHQL